MNDQQIVEYLRSRGHVAPPLDFTRSVMAAVDAGPASRSWFSAYLPAFVAAGAVAVVAILALILGPGRNIGPAPTPSATPSTSETEAHSTGELEAAVTDAVDRLAEYPGVQGTITGTIEEYLAFVTWFDWRPNGDQVVVTRTDRDVSAPWWTDPDGTPLTVDEHISTEILVGVSGDVYRTDDGTWLAADPYPGPLNFWTGVLDGSIDPVDDFPRGSQEDRRDLADGTTVWVLVIPEDGGRTIVEWTIGPDGVLESVSMAAEREPTVELAGSTGLEVEFTPLEEAGPIPRPDLGVPADADPFGVPADLPLAPPQPLNSVQLSECPPSSAPFRLFPPDGWWTNTSFEHPELGEIPACSYFAPGPFDATDFGPDLAFPDGVAIVVQYVDGGCVGSFVATLSSRETTVDGHPASLTEYATGTEETDPPGSYEYVVNLAPGVDCETGGQFVRAATRVEMAGDYETNKAILDQMMSTIQIEE